MNTNKDYIAGLIIGLGGFILLAFGWPTYSQISELKTVVKERESIYQERKVIIENINNFLNDYKKRSSDVAKLSSVVPAQKNEAELISTLEDISTKTGLQLSTMRISADKESDENTMYKKMVIEVTFKGNYQSLISFLQAIEKNLRIIDVSTVQISLNENMLSYKIRANAYVLK